MFFCLFFSQIRTKYFIKFLFWESRHCILKFKIHITDELSFSGCLGYKYQHEIGYTGLTSKVCGNFLILHLYSRHDRNIIKWPHESGNLQVSNVVFLFFVKCLHCLEIWILVAHTVKARSWFPCRVEIHSYFGDNFEWVRDMLSSGGSSEAN